VGPSAISIRCPCGAEPSVNMAIAANLLPWYGPMATTPPLGASSLQESPAYYSVISSGCVAIQIWDTRARNPPMIECDAIRKIQYTVHQSVKLPVSGWFQIM
jgi:hypothetical protein